MLEALRVRLARFAAAGLDGTIVAPFAPALAAMQPADFFKQFLCADLDARAVVVGENFRFGRGRSGDAAMLLALGAAHGVAVKVVPPVEVAAAPASSSRARKAVLAGDLALAADILGRPYSVVGEVVHGHARGRQLGYPTANVAVHADVLPPFGVYAAFVNAPAGTFLAAVSVGVHPTFAAAPAPKVEAYLLDCPGAELYDATLEVAFIARLRPELAFASVGALTAQMAQDVDQARRTLARHVAPTFVPLPQFALMQAALTTPASPAQST